MKRSGAGVCSARRVPEDGEGAADTGVEDGADGIDDIPGVGGVAGSAGTMGMTVTLVCVAPVGASAGLVGTSNSGSGNRMLVASTMGSPPGVYGREDPARRCTR